MSAELEEIRRELAEIKARIRPRRARSIDPCLMVHCRLTRAEVSAVDAAAQSRGMARSELIRHCLAEVIGCEIQPRKEIPPQFRARKKLDRFDDGKAPVREMASAEERSAKAREAVRLGYAAREAMAEAGLAPEVVSRERALSQRGMMADAPLRTVLKPSR